VIDVDGVVITVPNRIQAYMGDSYAKVVRMPLSINPIQLGVNYLSSRDQITLDPGRPRRLGRPREKLPSAGDVKNDTAGL
jgi:hypothetical protein